MSTLTDSIYEAVTRPEAWGGVVARIAGTLGAGNFAICAGNRQTDSYSVLSLPIAPEFTHSFETRWNVGNELWDASKLVPIGRTFSFDSLFQGDGFRRTEFFNEWWRPQRMEVALGANLLFDAPVAAVAVALRPASRPEFSTGEFRLFRELLPHLQRATQLRLRLASVDLRNEDFRAVLEALDKPALVVDRDCRILFANGHTERLIAEDVLAVSGNGSLTAWNTGETKLLRKLVFEAVGNGAVGPGGRIAVHRAAGRPLTLLIAPLHRSHSVFARPSSLILIDDPEQAAAHPDIGLLRAEYGLTNAEAKLALALVGGKNLRSAADELGIAFTTARVHLAHVFQKAEVGSQSGLVRLLIKGGLDM
jgi:DNA-binding CsgD family transcriptional regulator